MSIMEAEDIYRDPILIAAKIGNLEVVKQIIQAFPDAIYCSNPASFQNIFHAAVEHRATSVFHFLYETIESNHLYLDLPEVNGNNLLHLAAQLAPSHKLDSFTNPVLKMRSEMMWYKEIESIVNPHCKEQLNHAGKSPWLIFEEEHSNLRKEAETWVKATVNSCAITAALISSISFAAAITVPGGSISTTGYPFFGKSSVFTFFAVSDAISLIASTTSLIVFLDLTISRYSNEDFSNKIPEKVNIGIWALRLSIVFIMFGFSATIFLVFGQGHRWVLVLTVIIAAYIVMLFLLSPDPFIYTYLERRMSRRLRMSRRPATQFARPGTQLDSRPDRFLRRPANPGNRNCCSWI